MKILVISPAYSLSGVPLAQLRLAESLGKIGHNVDLIYGCKKHKKIEIMLINKILFNAENLYLSSRYPTIKTKIVPINMMLSSLLK